MTATVVYSSANPHPTYQAAIAAGEPIVVFDLREPWAPPRTCVLLSTNLDGSRWVLLPNGAPLAVPARYCTPPTRPGARTTDPDTAHRAWEAQNEHRLGRGQLVVLLALEAAGDWGMVDADHEEVNGLRPDSAGKRRLELVRKGLADQLPGVKRSTPRGEKAQVWVITAAGRQALRTGPPSLTHLAALATAS